MRRLINSQFPEYADFSIMPVEKQGHDNRTFRLGQDMLIRMPTAASYALKVPKEQELLPQLAPHLSFQIPIPLRMGYPSEIFPFPFSIYKWLDGISLNLINIRDEDVLNQLAFDLAKFLKELHAIDTSFGPIPGQHNWWRGDHVGVYDKNAKEQVAELAGIIDANRAMAVWNQACDTKWDRSPLWIHGDFAVGNILIKDNKLCAVIDFGGMAIGDPACDLVIAWTFFNHKAREIFVDTMDLDKNTWLRTRAWALWKATYELCKLEDKNGLDAAEHKKVILSVIV